MVKPISFLIYDEFDKEELVDFDPCDMYLIFQYRGRYAGKVNIKDLAECLGLAGGVGGDSEMACKVCAEDRVNGGIGDLILQPDGTYNFFKKSPFPPQLRENVNLNDFGECPEATAESLGNDKWFSGDYVTDPMSEYCGQAISYCRIDGVIKRVVFDPNVDGGFMEIDMSITQGAPTQKDEGCTYDKENATVCFAGPATVTKAEVDAAIKATGKKWNNGDDMDPAADESVLCGRRVRQMGCSELCNGNSVTFDGDNTPGAEVPGTVIHQAGAANPASGMLYGNGTSTSASQGTLAEQFSDPLQEVDDYVIADGAALEFCDTRLRKLDSDGNVVSAKSK